MIMRALKFVFLFNAFMATRLIQNVPLNGAVIIKFTNYKCENINPSILQIHQCRLKAVRRDVVTLNFNATLLEKAQQIRIEAGLYKRANGYKPWLYKVDFDGCRFLRKAYNPIVKVFVGDLIRFSNFNHSCPYEGLVFVQGFYLRAEVARLPFPTGDYLIETKWHVNQKPAGIAKYYFTFVEDL